MLFSEFIKTKNRMTRINSHGACTIECSTCPIFAAKPEDINCDDFIKLYPDKAENILMAWNELHPLISNKQKFKELFGYEIYASNSPHNGYLILNDTNMRSQTALEEWLNGEFIYKGESINPENNEENYEESTF